MAQEAEASRLINLVAALKANSQAYPVDVILPYDCWPVVGARLCGGEAVAQATSSGLSFLRCEF